MMSDFLPGIRPAVRVRQATPADRPALAEIFLASRRQAFPWEEETAFALADFGPQTEGEEVRLAEDAATGQALGFLSVWLPERFIHHLFVHPSRLGQGIGRKLLEDAADWLPRPWRLKCKTANRPALGFYLHLGWRELSRHEAAGGEYALMEFGGPPGEPAAS